MELKTLDDKCFELKVRSMTAYEIIMAMVDGLKNPVTIIEMGTYGTKDESGLCFGCAATNTICKIAGLNIEQIVDLLPWEDTGDGGFAYGKEGGFVMDFETAINGLRLGDLSTYNKYAHKWLFSHIEYKPGLILLQLLNSFTEHELNGYIELAEHNKGGH